MSELRLGDTRDYLNKITHADCLSILKQLPNNSIDLVITDPPYLYKNTKVGTDSQFAKQLQKALDGIEEIKDGVTLEFCEEIIRLQEKVNAYIWCSKDQLIDYLDFFVTKNGCSFDILWWYKKNAMPTFNNKLLTDKEYCLYFRKGGYCMPKNYEDARTLFLEPINAKDKQLWEHPTIKPEKIIKTMLRNCSKEGDVILDCFSGSGTVAKCCKDMKRNFIAIELEQKWVDISRKRLDIADNQLKLF